MTKKRLTIKNLSFIFCALPFIFACSLLDYFSTPPTRDCIEPPNYGEPITAQQESYRDPVLTPFPEPEDPAIPRTIWCPHPVAPAPALEPTATPAGDVFQRGEIFNLSLNMGDTTTLDAAIGSHGSIIAWREDAELIVQIDRKNYTDVARLGIALDAAVAYSQGERAHIIYSREGGRAFLNYRASDAGAFIEDAPEEVVGFGTDPELFVDPDGWANLLYIYRGELLHRIQGETAWSEPYNLGPAEAVEAIVQDDGSVLATVQNGNVISVRIFAGGTWTQATVFSHDDINGEVRLDNDGGHSYIAFVTENISPDAAPAHGFNTIQVAYSNNYGRSWIPPKEVIRNEIDGETSGRIAPPVYPVVALHKGDEAAIHFLYIFEEGNPPDEVPDALRYGRIRHAECSLNITICDTEPPGQEPYSRLSFFPSENLIVDTNPNHSSSIIGWTGLQVGEEAREVYETFLNPQSLGR